MASAEWLGKGAIRGPPVHVLLGSSYREYAAISSAWGEATRMPQFLQLGRAFYQQLGNSPHPWGYREWSLEQPKGVTNERHLLPQLQRAVLGATLAQEGLQEYLLMGVSYGKGS